jgi:putative ABC transport system permease protein
MKQHLVDEVRPAIFALMGAVIFLLLIACANVANLRLVRASSRERELAVRAALGAGWWQLVRQTLAEAILIAGIGTVIGVGLAYLGIRQLLWIAPANLPRLNRQIDGQVSLLSISRPRVRSLFGSFRHSAPRPNLMDVFEQQPKQHAAAGLRNGVVVVGSCARICH